MPTPATSCAHCGTTLPAGAGRCPQCLALVKRPGLLQRLLGKLNLSFNVSVDDAPDAGPPGVHTTCTVRTNTRIKIHDATTGETHEYQSLEDVPAKYREKLAALRAAPSASPTSTSEHITIRDADGTEQTYRSMAEVPPHLRALIERARRGEK